ncbi:MAG TPA: ATP-binding protein, partial [Chloroflexota bacterium]|nr:ATP-binding protein [Chloroflexota bacterium]
VITLQETDLNIVVEQVSKMLRRLIGEDITFATALAPNLKPARVDAGQIEQILLNLATNARDAMPHGGKLTIETHNVELGEVDTRQHPGVRIGSFVVIEVRDTGTGMDEATKAHIFEPFFTTKDVGRGTGLGLAAVYGIVQQSGGFVDVSSELGKGTSFKIYFPDATPEPLPVLPHEPVAKSFRGTETILLVEDEERVRDLARTALVGAGYRVLEAAGGESALRLIADSAQPIDLLVTDVVMPGLNGRQLAERLLEPYPAMKVLYVSGYTFDLVVRHGVFESGVAFLQKPFTPSSLTRKVREVLDVLVG